MRLCKPNMFLRASINLDDNPFEELSISANFEDITTGRKGAVIVHNEDNMIPIVRTTTIYQNNARQFLPIHYEIIQKIKDQFKSLNVGFNNALIEIYDDNYFNMGFHSDQSLDLDDNSYIGVFSCYENPEHLTDKNNRKLKVRNKTTKAASEIMLEHNSVVLFSTTVNQEHLHKIALDGKSHTRWLGITFRLSKTSIKFIDNVPYFDDDKQLTLASEDEKMQFYKLRRSENKQTHHKYPKINYTISASDMLPPTI